VPPEFDYDFWLGHTPVVPYHEQQCHFFWRFNLAWGGGEMTDRGAHIIDLGQYLIGKDDTGPVRYTASGVQTTGLYNTFFDFDFENQYADGMKMIGTSKTGPRGIGFEGDQGKLFIHIHDAALEAEPASLLDGPVGPSHEAAHQHRRNFLDCVRSRELPHAHAEAGHRTATICHLNNIAMQLKQSFAWDPVAEQTDSDDANKMLTASMRSPWKL
jgi:predicted dehydrogenase